MYKNSFTHPDACAYASPYHCACASLYPGTFGNFYRFAHASPYPGAHTHPYRCVYASPYP